MVRLTIITAMAFIFLVTPVPATILYVPSQYPTIQAGCDAGMNGDTVLVQSGIYHENVLIGQHHITLGSFFLTTGDTSYISTTVIDGDSLNSVIRFNNWLDSLSVLAGFTLTHGGGIYGGGGIHTEGSPTISNNIIEYNSATRGGGIYSTGSPLIIDNIIRNNHVTVAGGGIISYGGAFIIDGNIISGNSSEAYGGGIHLEDSQMTIIKGNMILGNTAVNSGGGILYYADNMGGILEANVIAGNEADQYSSIGFYGGAYQIINNTIYNNGFTQFGLTFWEDNEATLVNNIIWNNANVEILIDSMAIVSVAYCDVQGGFAGEGNINSIPGFRDAENGDFHLMATECEGMFDSPCIDAGDPEIYDELLNCGHGLGALRSDIGAYGGLDSAGTSINESISPFPSGFALSQNYPNPFNATTLIAVDGVDRADIYIFDIAGRKVASLRAEGGRAVWEAKVFSSGFYFARAVMGWRISNTVKLVYLK